VSQKEIDATLLFMTIVVAVALLLC